MQQQKEIKKRLHGMLDEVYQAGRMGQVYHLSQIEAEFAQAYTCSERAKPSGEICAVFSDVAQLFRKSYALGCAAREQENRPLGQSEAAAANAAL